MRFEYTKDDGDLKREVWKFDLDISYSSTAIRFDSYYFQTRPSRRHKLWQKQTHWERLDKRNNKIGAPNIPTEVDNAMRQYFAEQIKLLPISL